MRGYIYKIYTLDNKMEYYASTTQRVCKRMADHKYLHKKWKDGESGFSPSYPIIDTNDYKYMTMEVMDFDERFELKNRERWYIENNECVNKIPFSASRVEYHKKYYKEHKTEMLEKQKQYYKEQKTERKIYAKEYIKNNKEKYDERVTCNCGTLIRWGDYHQHCKSDKHKTLLNSLNETEILKVSLPNTLLS